jgi:hypothetical protein
MRPALILAIGLAVHLTPCVDASESKNLRPSLGPVSLGDTRAGVQGKLGKPSKVEDIGDHLGSRWRYEGLDVYYYVDPPFLVGQIETTNPLYCTASGVCPGQALAVASSKLGPPMGGGSLKEGTSSYAVDSVACWLEVEVQKSKVSMLAIKCQP